VNILHRPHAAQVEPAQRFRLSGVDWQSYEQILEALGEHHVRITYDRGELELMSPLSPHELCKTFFVKLLYVLCEELDLPVKCCGSVTIRRQAVARGLEPDECFYLESAAQVRDWRTLDLAHDPPPDLAVEIDISRSCLDRFGVYAALGVPEVWRFDGTTLQAYRLAANATYDPVSVSPSLPFLPLDEVLPLLERTFSDQDDRAQMRALREWVRQRVLPLYQAANPPPPPSP
jgi:Uma2 family endonuclease